ncbi:hypothetical protein NDU88_010209 [Pleurodeles waltl]|uniref:Uncharacterized protein n=1 Tax=Pleurodeles waltl TaxID=8319 RepID=A0AAV7Q1A4_PLEWA|nr:hypothetical protein NDU88_010209 [Pleurodeles waltl]
MAGPRSKAKAVSCVVCSEPWGLELDSPVRYTRLGSAGTWLGCKLSPLSSRSSVTTVTIPLLSCYELRPIAVDSAFHQKHSIFMRDLLPDSTISFFDL